MKLSKKTKKAGAFTGLLVIMIVLLSVFLPGLLEPSVAVTIYPEEHLFVDATYLLKTDETNETVNVTCDIYLTNIWEKESGDIKAIAYVIETKNNFAIFKTEVEIGEIGADTTDNIAIPVVLSNNSYKVEVLLFEKGKLVIKGELRLDAYPKYTWDEIKHGKAQEWVVENTYSSFRSIR